MSIDISEFDPRGEFVRTAVQARQFIRSCVRVIGIGYHPDTPFADYVDGDGRPTLSDDGAAYLQGQHDEAVRLLEKFALHDLDVYAVALAAVREFYSQLFIGGAE